MKRIFGLSILLLLVVNSVTASLDYKAGVYCGGTGSGEATISVSVTKCESALPTTDTQSSTTSEIKYAMVSDSKESCWGLKLRFTSATYTADAATGSIFLGWFKPGASEATNTSTSYKCWSGIKEVSDIQDNGKYQVYYAKFDTIAIKAKTTAGSIAIKDLPPGAIDGTAPLVFETNAPNGYGSITYSISGETNGTFEVVGTPSISNGSISVSYRYMPNGNVHIVNPQDDHATLAITLSK